MHVTSDTVLIRSTCQYNSSMLMCKQVICSRWRWRSILHIAFIWSLVMPHPQMPTCSSPQQLYTYIYYIYIYYIYMYTQYMLVWFGPLQLLTVAHMSNCSSRTSRASRACGELAAVRSSLASYIYIYIIIYIYIYILIYTYINICMLQYNQLHSWNSLPIKL